MYEVGRLRYIDPVYTLMHIHNTAEVMLVCMECVAWPGEL
jgi:hypothetical protein